MKNFKRGTLALSILIALLCVVGCTNKEDERQIERMRNHCEPDTVDLRANFILQCINNGNPKSDEEPEDWITKCQDMAEDTYCPKKTYKITQRCGSNSGCLWYEVDAKPKDT